MYALVGLLATLVPYVGGYWLLGEYSSPPEGVGLHFRYFESEVSRKVFGPMGYVEAQIRGETVALYGPSFVDPSDLDIYRSD